MRVEYNKYCGSRQGWCSAGGVGRARGGVDERIQVTQWHAIEDVECCKGSRWDLRVNSAAMVG